MPTDTERREVARRLRSFVTDDSVYADVDACRVLHSIGLYYKDIDRIYFSGFDVARLADLIEPDHIGDSNKMVDRDGMLTVAETMDQDAFLYRGAARSFTECGNHDAAEICYEAAGEYNDYAKAIREALGKSDG